MKLSKRIRKWANPRAELEAERDDYRNKYYLSKTTIMCREDRINELESVNEALKCDLSKPPAERKYCAGCSLLHNTQEVE